MRVGRTVRRRWASTVWLACVFALASGTVVTLVAGARRLGGTSPDFGSMIFKSLGYMQTDPAYTIIPGVVILLLVLAFNMFGDSLRDALDPKSSR